MIRSASFTISSLRSFRSATFRRSIYFSIGASGRLTTFHSIRQTFIRSAHKFRHHTQEKFLPSIPLMPSQFHFGIRVFDCKRCKLCKRCKTPRTPPFNKRIFVSFLSVTSLASPTAPSTGLPNLTIHSLRSFMTYLCFEGSLYKV